jgi:hypothetical protein
MGFTKAASFEGVDINAAIEGPATRDPIISRKKIMFSLSRKSILTISFSTKKKKKKREDSESLSRVRKFKVKALWKWSCIIWKITIIPYPAPPYSLTQSSSDYLDKENEWNQNKKRRKWRGWRGSGSTYNNKEDFPFSNICRTDKERFRRRFRKRKEEDSEDSEEEGRGKDDKRWRSGDERFPYPR